MAWREFLEIFADSVDQGEEGLKLARRMGALDSNDRIPESAWTVAQLYCGFMYVSRGVPDKE